MSTILKALQRLEDEKGDKEDLSLDEQITARRSRTSAKGRWLVIGISLLGGIAVGSSLLYIWRGGAPAADVTSEGDPTVVASAASQPKPEQLAPKLPAEPPTPARALKREQAPARALKREQVANGAATPVLPDVEVVKRLDGMPAAEPVLAEPSAPDPNAPGASRPADRRRAARRAARKQAGETPTERTNSRPAAAFSKRVPEPGAPKPRVPKPGSAVAPVVVAAADPIEVAAAAEPTELVAPAEPIEAKPSRATPAVKDAAVIPDPPLEAAEPSQPVSAPTSPQTPPKSASKLIRRAAIPLLSVDRTIWHPDADRRLAVVELVDSGESMQLKEGDAVGPLVIEAIRPGGVLFSHDGVEVEYRVGQ